MPVHLERLERNIYIAKWCGNVDSTDLFEAVNDLDQLFQQYGDTGGCVYIIDSSLIRGIDFKLDHLISSLRLLMNVEAILLVGSVAIGMVMMHRLDQVTRRHIEFCRSIHDAVNRANQLLADTFIGDDTIELEPIDW